MPRPPPRNLPAAASYDFAKAVADKNGNKATELLQSNPPGIVNGRDNDGNTALIIAIARQDPDWTGFLIGKGADPTCPQGRRHAADRRRPIRFRGSGRLAASAGAKVDAANRAGRDAADRRGPAARLAHGRACCSSAGADPDKSDSRAGFSAREYAERDPARRQLLQRSTAQAEAGRASRYSSFAQRRVDLRRQTARRAAREMQQLGLAPRRRQRPMGCLADDRRIVAVGDDQPRLACGRKRSSSRSARQRGGTAQKKRSQ